VQPGDVIVLVVVTGIEPRALTLASEASAPRSGGGQNAFKARPSSVFNGFRRHSTTDAVRRAGQSCRRSPGCRSQRPRREGLTPCDLPPVFGKMEAVCAVTVPESLHCCRGSRQREKAKTVSSRAIRCSLFRWTGACSLFLLLVEERYAPWPDDGGRSFFFSGPDTRGRYVVMRPCGGFGSLVRLDGPHIGD